MKIRYSIAVGLIVLGFIIHTIGGELTDIRFMMKSGIADNFKL
jgi:hypothetical protein